jgi:integrase
MGRQVHRLSARAVETKKRPGYYADGGGLYLQVGLTLTKSWIFRYTLKARAHEMGLGSLLDVSLAQARAKASECRLKLADGIDPLTAKKERTLQARLDKASTITFRHCAEKYIAAHRSSWNNARHAAQWKNTLDTYAVPSIGHLAVKDVDTALVIRVLEPIWTKKPETASRVRGRIEHILDWARVMGYRTGENPARWRGHIDKLLASTARSRRDNHHAALPYDEIGSFISDLRRLEGTSPQALEFCILTAARTGEVIGARPDELDLEKGLWTVPAKRMKGGREHRVPLSSRAIEIVRAQPKGDYVFPGMNEGEPLSNMGMLVLLRRMGRDDVTVHGFRSTFRDWAAERTNYPNHVLEMALAHAIGDKAEAAYRRGDLFEKRRRLMLDWAKYCEMPSSQGKVVSIKKAAATAAA